MDLLNIDIGAPGGVNETLERNLEALEAGSPEVAARVRQALPRLDAELVDTPEGVPGLRLEGKTLASCRRPLSEAEKLADAAGVRDNAVVCLIGFGAGHHAGAIARRMGDRGVLLCFEPDVSLLRAVLERIDHSAWLRACRVRLLSDAQDRAAIVRTLTGLEGLIGLGVKVLDHPASKSRLGGAAGAFAERFGEVIAATRTQVLTTLVHAETTLRNELMNANRYAASPGLDELAGRARGRTGIVVSAGPGLARNGHLLRDPRVREHALIIAAQTALKPLLKMGVRPHLVTSLDHHEISRRFYEGLTPEDVRGVTLVCEPKVNPAVPGAFPGEVRYVGSELLDIVLGEQLARPRATLPAGATVAHLSYQLARFMGCDPVVLVGQDLAFTDGLYYGPGAAIHEVWAGELGAFRSLELLEWERIARSKRTLRVTRDQRGEPVFTDEQMASYLASFEELFSHDRKLGRRVIDASEGGAAKQHAEVMTLRDALALAVRQGEDAPDADLESASASAGTTASGRTPAAVGERLDTIAQQAQSIASGSREAASLLSRMAAVHRDHARVNELIAQVYAVRDRVTALTPGYRVVDFLNQTGAMRRIKADRAIELDAGADELERQRLQIERDRQNVEWTAEAADRVGELMHAAARVARDEAERQTRAETDAPDGAGAANAGEIDAIIIVDPETGGLWSPRTLEGVLVRTVERVLRSSVRACVLVCEQPERVRSMLGAVARDGRVVVERANLRATSARRASIGAARRHAASSWRGGPGSLTIYDEAFDPSIAERIMTERSAAAAIVLGADWAMIDPALIDACCDRWRETGSRMVFTQAAPGLAPCVIDLKTTQTLGEASRGNSHFASIGAVLGYLPTTPQSDPIASTMCVRVDPAVRDLGVRCVEDAAPGLLDEIDASDDAPTIARKLRGRAAAGLPRELMLEVCTGRLGGGAWGRWLRGGDEPVERTPLTMALAHRVLRAFALGRPDGALTLHGVGDPMMHPKALDIVRMGEELGLHGLHLRTELTGTDVDEAMLLESGAGVISIDLLATTAKTREAISGHDRFEVADARAERLAVRAREDACGGMPGLWVVPRITRCAQASGEIPDFVDRWIMTCGSAAIDPGPAVDDTGSDRFRPLPIPASAGQRLERDRLVVLCDGRVRGAGGAIIEGVDLNTCTLDEAWRAVSVTHQRAAAELEAKRRAAGAHARTGTRAEAAA